MENTFCLFFDFWLNSAVDRGCFHARNVLQTLHSVKFLLLNVPDHLLPLAFGAQPAQAGCVTKVPQAWELGESAR
jgi:hypothetical protein